MPQLHQILVFFFYLRNFAAKFYRQNLRTFSADFFRHVILIPVVTAMRGGLTQSQLVSSKLTKTKFALKGRPPEPKVQFSKIGSLEV